MPSLFQGLVEGIPGRGVTRLQKKQAGIALPDPTSMAPENWTTSCVITGHLVTALSGQEESRMADHVTCLREGREEVRKRNTRRS